MRVEEVRGFLPCPWNHKGLYGKVNVFLLNSRTDDEVIWTALSLHLLGAHGFYGGKGSPYRLEPDFLARVVGLAPER